MVDASGASGEPHRPGLPVVLREWARIGCIGFGGPPAHIALLRELCVERRGWLTDREFEDAIAVTNLLPGPSSTQLAIYCAWRVNGGAGALVGGLSFIVPGLILILALAVLFLSASPPNWVRGAGAGAAVAAVAVQAGASLAPASWGRASARWRWIVYALLGGLSAATVGPWLVLVLLGSGAFELVARRARRSPGDQLALHAWPVVAVAAGASGGLLALAWVAFKVGALSYGGGFVIIPLLHADAVDTYHWMTDGEFLSAVALGQITPGPVVQTVAVIGYAAAGIGGGLLAATVAFAPSFSFIVIGAERFDRLRANASVRSFLEARRPGRHRRDHRRCHSARLALTENWQFAVLAAATIALFVLRRGIVSTLVGAGAIGALAATLGASLPS